MKNIIRKLAVVAAIVLCLAQTCQVFATENSNVTLKNQGINMKQRTIQVQCDISGADPITNGKIRILYNSSQLHLKANEKGELVTKVAIRKKGKSFLHLHRPRSCLHRDV